MTGLLVLVGAMLSGCATYHAQPLTDASVAKVLAVPAPSILAAQARQLDRSFLPAFPAHPGSSLSPADAAVLAVLLNPHLKADRARTGLAEAQMIQAGLLPNPQLDLSLGKVTGGPGTADPHSAGLGWDITGLLGRGAKVRSAREHAAAVRLDVAWSEWQTAAAAESALYRVAALDQEVREAGRARQALDRTLAQVSAGYRRHLATVLQLSAVQGAAVNSRDTELKLRKQRAAQRLKLRQAIGVPAGYPLAPPRSGMLPCHLTPPSLQVLVPGIRHRRFDLLGLERGYRSQEAQVRAAILAQFPKINLGFDQSVDNSGVAVFGLHATIGLPIFTRGQGRIAVTRATRRKLFDEYAARLYDAEQHVQALSSDIAQLDGQIAAKREGIERLDRLVRSYRRAVSLGNADILNFYDLRQRLFQARIDLLKMEGDLADDWVSLQLASGQRLPQATSCSAGGIP